MQNDLEYGWTTDMKDVHRSFSIHRDLLLLLKRLDLINSFILGCCQRDFEQKTWSKIRDGEDLWL